MRLVAFAVLLMLAMSADAETDCEFPEAMCNAQAEFEHADAQMVKTLGAVQTKIANNGFEDFMVEPGDIAESLELGQAAWANYRDGHCAAVFRLMSGGTSRQVDELDCMTVLTEARTVQLRELYDVAP